MQGKLLLVAGLAVGYVLGARRGREGFEKLKRQASQTWRSPNVQRTVSSARQFAEDKIPVVGDAISDAVKKVNDAATATAGGAADGAAGTTGTTGEGTTGTTGTTGGGTTGTTPSTPSPSGNV
jgi:lipid-binding SYLF domain-containing protein